MTYFSYILCFTLCHKRYLTLPYVTSLEMHSALELLPMALLYCHLTASRLRKAAHWQRQFLYLPSAVFIAVMLVGPR